MNIKNGVNEKGMYVNIYFKKTTGGNPYYINNENLYKCSLLLKKLISTEWGFEISIMSFKGGKGNASSYDCELNILIKDNDNDNKSIENIAAFERTIMEFGAKMKILRGD